MNKTPSNGLPWRRYLIEFVILFFGVFLAFVSEDFREDLQDRKREAEYLDAISCDLHNELSELQDNCVVMEKKLQQMNLLFVAVRKESVSDDSLIKFIPAFVYNFLIPSTPNSSYESMKSSGDLRLISDKDLRFSLVKLDYSRTEFAGQTEVLSGYLKSSHRAFLEGFFDYERDRPFAKASVRDPFTLSKLNLCRLELSGYLAYLRGHIGHLHNMRDKLTIIAPCVASADSTVSR